MPRRHHNKRAALYNITDKGLSTREETVTRILQQACDSVASRIGEVGQGTRSRLITSNSAQGSSSTINRLRSVERDGLTMNKRKVALGYDHVIVAGLPKSLPPKKPDSPRGHPAALAVKNDGHQDASPVILTEGDNKTPANRLNQTLDLSSSSSDCY